MNTLIPVFIANMSLLGSGLLLFYKTWLPCLRPDLFYNFNIFDHNLLNYKTHKIFLPTRGCKDQYEFNNCAYSKNQFMPYINDQGVYTWNFIKGYVNPIGFIPSVKNNFDGRLIAEAQKTSMDDIWLHNTSFEEFIKTYGVVFLALIIFCLFAYLIYINKQMGVG